MRKLIALALITNLCYASSLPKLIDHTEPKVVKIGIVMDKKQRVCSGAFISSTGIVLTCAHCFAHRGIKKVFIKTSNEKFYPAALLAVDFKNDLALVVPNETGPFPYFQLGAEPSKGDLVMAFGSPLGIQHTVSVGIVENIIDQVHIIIHGAFINPGNSGGPLVDKSGKLVGVNEAILMIDPLILAQGLYVAIDIVRIKEFLQKAATK